ncbi:uncharacterized protein METZ01_LOCUS346481 [marine metagenome]|uniref:Restriction endonuclease type IV Mrr domain-containing protein n=1 Tax=marine metagenome TaxID=408172 RepID=A0A382R913_9ZZZZ
MGAERDPNPAGLRRCNARTREGSLCLKSANRQFGIFVTTSWVSEQAYKELVEDRHPVLVISGRDIIEILRSGMSIRSGKDMLDWLSTVAPKQRTRRWHRDDQRT